MQRIGPHSRPHRLALVDGRTAEARLMAEHRRELTEHCGGKPSVTQRALIERTVLLHLRLHLMDRETIRTPGMAERNGREYICLNSAYTRTIKALGIKGAIQAPPATPTLRDHLARRAAGASS
jgi:hypothetical protein